MSIYAVHYEYNATMSEELAANRPAHRAFLKGLFGDGRLLASGPLGTIGALIVVVANDQEAALELLAHDPLLEHGVIETRTARQWNPVIGPWDTASLLS